VTEPTSKPAKRKYAPRLPRDERREHLMDAALRVIVRDGYEAVSIEAIAREADVTRPVVYGAYDGLEPLLHALLDRTRNRALAQVMNLLAEAGTPEDVDAWAVGAIGSMIDCVQEDPDVWRPILGLVSGAPALVRDRIASTRELIRGSLEAGIEAGLQQRGGPFLDSRILSHLVIATAEEFGPLILEDPPSYTRDHLVTAFEALLKAAPPSAD